MIYNFPSLRSYDTGVLLLWYLLRKVSMSSIVDELRPIWRGLLRCWCSWASDLLLLPLLWEWCKTWRIIESVTRGCRCNEVWITKTKLHFFRHEYNSIPSNLNTSSQLFSLHYCCFKFPSFFISVISQLTTQKTVCNTNTFILIKYLVLTKQYNFKLCTCLCNRCNSNYVICT